MMTNMTSIARPYAKAAFEIAVEKAQLAEWAGFLEHLTQIVSDPTCVGFILEPSTTPQEHCDLLETILKSFKALNKNSEEMLNFVALLAKNKRLLAIASIEQVFQKLRADYEKTLTVDVVSFSKLTEEQIKTLKTHLNKRLQRDITLNITLDSSILGGMIIRAGNFVLDGSVRTQIKNLSNILAA